MSQRKKQKAEIGKAEMKIKTFTPWNSNRPGAEKNRGFIPLGNNRNLESRNNFSFLLSLRAVCRSGQEARFLLSLRAGSSALEAALAFAFCFRHFCF
jgi:hypothetical protein